MEDSYEIFVSFLSAGRSYLVEIVEGRISLFSPVSESSWKDQLLRAIFPELLKELTGVAAG